MRYSWRFFRYDKTRNHIISISNLEKYKISLFLDDTYHIHGKISENRLIWIIDEKSQYSYQRNLIVKPSEYYVDKIHETIKTNDILKDNKTFYIFDKWCFSNELRRILRVPMDLELLKDDMSKRGLIYRMGLYLKVYKYTEAALVSKVLEKLYNS